MTVLMFTNEAIPKAGKGNLTLRCIVPANAKTIRWIDNKAGKEVIKWQFTVSADGKTQSWTGKVRDAKGQEVTHSQFFEKQ